MYFVDESRIEKKHDEWIAKDKELCDHAALVNSSLEFIYWVNHEAAPNEAVKKGDDGADADMLILVRLLVRCFNSAASSLKLLRCGYWQPSFAQIRDLLETSFLLDLLSDDREKLKLWRTLEEKERKKAFSPVKVRVILDTRDGYTDKRREKAYRDLTVYAAHPTPEGFSIISPNMMTQIGPYPCEKNLRAALQELAKHFAPVGDCASHLVTGETVDILNKKVEFFETLNGWASIYLKN